MHRVYGKHCSYRHSDFLLVDYSLNVFYRVTPFKQAQTSLFLTQSTYLILLPHSITLLYIFKYTFFHLTSIFRFVPIAIGTVYHLQEVNIPLQWIMHW